MCLWTLCITDVTVSVFGCDNKWLWAGKQSIRVSFSNFAGIKMNFFNLDSRRTTLHNMIWNLLLCISCECRKGRDYYYKQCVNHDIVYTNYTIELCNYLIIRFYGLWFYCWCLFWFPIRYQDEIIIIIIIMKMKLTKHHYNEYSEWVSKLKQDHLTGTFMAQIQTSLII